MCKDLRTSEPGAEFWVCREEGCGAGKNLALHQEWVLGKALAW